MSVATLAIRPLEGQPTIRQLVLDCPHGTTRIWIHEAPQGVHVDDAEAVRLALARHHDEEGCRCTRKLWRQYYGAPLGELVLARGTP